MKKNFSVQINNPCDQPWNKMTENNQGRFCDHCAKTVVDFTHLTDFKIIELLENNDEKVCGRFTQHQLNRNLLPSENKNIPQLLNYLASALLIGSSNNAIAQGGLILHPQKISQTKDTLEHSFLDVKDRVIQGTIIDSLRHDTLSAVIITIKNSSVRAISDVNGNFTLNVPDSFNLRFLVLEFTYMDETTEQIVENITYPLNKNFYLKTELMMRGEVDIFMVGGITLPKRKWWQFWKRR